MNNIDAIKQAIAYLQRYQDRRENDLEIAKSVRNAMSLQVAEQDVKGIRETIQVLHKIVN